MKLAMPKHLIVLVGGDSGYEILTPKKICVIIHSSFGCMIG